MNKRLLVASAIWLAVAAPGAGQPRLNWIVSTTGGPQGGPANPAVPNGFIVATDCDALTSQVSPLPLGFRPGSLVAMDRFGDVWLDNFFSGVLCKFRHDGTLLATVNVPYPPHYMTCDRDGNLIVGAIPGNPPRAYLYRYSPSGQLLHSVELTSLFTPGVLSPVPFSTTFDSIPRILVSKSGSIWVALLSAGYYPVIHLDSNFGLLQGITLPFPTDLLPDEDEGVWVPIFQPGQTGWVHVNNSGVILQPTVPANISMFAPQHNQVRVDGRWYLNAQPGGSPYTGLIMVHEPWYPPSAWWLPTGNLIFPGSFSGNPSIQADQNVNFWLDGAQRVWSMMVVPPMTNTSLGVNFAWQYWLRHAVDGPWPSYQMRTIGNVWMLYNTPASYYWTTFWGETTLHLYCLYTAPDGDLDQDGVPNREELKNRTNPLVSSAGSMAITPTLAGPGSWMTIDYTIAGDAGLLYFAPFFFTVTPTSLGGGYTIPFSLSDPLVLECLNPHWPWLQGVTGILNGLGHAQARIQLPALPLLTGIQIQSAIVTRDPNLPTLLKTISPATTLTIQ